MSNEILKPMSVARAEFISALTGLINNSMLPLFVIEPILKDIYNDIHMLAQKQLEKDTEDYNQKLYQSNNSENV